MTKVTDLIDNLKQEIEGIKVSARVQKEGEVLEISDGVAKISGLSDCKSMEMLEFISQKASKEKIYGLALNLEEDQIGAVILGDFEKIKAGDKVTLTGKVLEVPVGEELIGRVVNPLGEPLDGKGPIKTKKTSVVEKIAPKVITRQPVNTPVQTGIVAIDSMIPIGRGQRELLIGDRQTGKTALAVDSIINQKGKDLICIYVAIGQKESKVAKTVAKLEEFGALDHTIVVLASASDPAPLWYLAPYAGCAMGEYFRDQGQDALIIYDDLSKHAWAYRQISLLLRRPPGREAYPGDVFYLHSRLLERAAKLNKEHGGGSLTALPIIETQAGDISAYIPTNVISITDGQIYLETDLFYAGVRPAVNVGLSVSRVGGAAQTLAMKKVAGRLRLDLAQFRELQAFAQFATELDPETKQRLERGKRIVEILKQDQYQPLPVSEQVCLLYAATGGFLDQVPENSLKKLPEDLLNTLRTRGKAILQDIEKTKDLTKATQEKLKKIIEGVTKVYLVEKSDVPKESGVGLRSPGMDRSIGEDKNG